MTKRGKKRRVKRRFELKEFHPLTAKEIEEVKTKSLEEINPVLEELDDWRKRSLASNFIFI